MKRGELLKRAQQVCRTRHFQWKTEQAYLWQIGRFLDFCRDHPQFTQDTSRVRGWLEDMAPRCSARSQAQALNAVAGFLFRHVLPREVLAAPSPLDLLRNATKIEPLYVLPAATKELTA